MNRIHLTLVMLFSVANIMSQWKQTEFVIGATNGPTLLGDGNSIVDVHSVQELKNANYNLILRFGYTGTGDPTTLHKFTDASSANASISYQLGILNQVPGVKMFLNDEDYTVEAKSVCTRDSDGRNLYCSDLNGIGHTYGYMEYLQINSMINKYINHSNKNLIMGYNLGDEPEANDEFDDYLEGLEYLTIGTGGTITQESPPNGYQTSAPFTTAGVSTSGDPDLLSWFNFKSAWGFGADNWSGTDGYVEHVQDYISHPATKVASMDYYVLERNSENYSISNGYFTVEDGPDPDEPSYYAHLNLFSTEIKSVLDAGTKEEMNFWNVGMATQHHIDDGRHHPYPNETRLRFYASSGIIYGAKGIIWYGYEQYPNTNGQTYYNAPTTDASIMASLTTINGELQKMGPILMKLNWETTVHGASVDPNSEEGLNGIPLPILNSSSPAFVDQNPLSAASDASSSWNDDTLAIGIHRSGAHYYLTLMNKSVNVFEGYWEDANGIQFLDIAGNIKRFPIANASDNFTSPMNPNVLGTPDDKEFVNKTKYTVEGHLYPRQLNKNSGGWEFADNITFSASKNSTSFEVTVNPADVEMVWLDKSERVPAIYTPLLLN